MVKLHGLARRDRGQIDIASLSVAGDQYQTKGKD